MRYMTFLFELQYLFFLVLFSGNGTLNKHAGIDYKQLSLLAKINENQSGEVLSLINCALVMCFSYVHVWLHIVLLSFLHLSPFCLAVARALARK